MRVLPSCKYTLQKCNAIKNIGLYTFGSQSKSFTGHTLMQTKSVLSPAIFLSIATLTLIVCMARPAFAATLPTPPKTLYQIVAPGNAGFDPAKHGDNVSRQLQEAVFDRLLTYDYLARPAKLVAAAAELPAVSNAGKTFAIRITPQTMFTHDAILKNKARELTAEDIAYSLKRHADPANNSPSRALFVGKIVGLDALEQSARNQGKFDADAMVAGFEVVDRYTLNIHLTETDYDFPYVLAHPAASIVAREMIDTQFGIAHARPVGSGPYQLETLTPNKKITLIANPAFRAAKGNASRDSRLKIQRVELVFESDLDKQWQQFVDGNIDLLDRLTPASAARSIIDGKLSPQLAAQGIKLHKAPEPEIIYYYLNMRDPVVGGYTVEKRALRRAILQSFDVGAEIRDIRNNIGQVGYSPIPPGVNGHDPTYRTQLAYDPVQANKTLDDYGFRRDAGGWRAMPDGTPLVVTFSSEPLDGVRPYAALRKKGLEQIGIKMETRLQTFQENLASAEKCELAYWGSAWRATVPTASYFLQLLSSKALNKGNLACYESAAFDQLFEEAKKLHDSGARSALYTRMMRLIEEDGVWQLGTNRVALTLLKPRVHGYVRHPMLHSLWQYLDVNEAKQGAPK
jgi:ABC-type transport system substrate-binding protein